MYERMTNTKDTRGGTGSDHLWDSQSRKIASKYFHVISWWNAREAPRVRDKFAEVPRPPACFLNTPYRRGNRLIISPSSSFQYYNHIGDDYNAMFGVYSRECNESTFQRSPQSYTRMDAGYKGTYRGQPSNGQNVGMQLHSHVKWTSTPTISWVWVVTKMIQSYEIKYSSSSALADASFSNNCPLIFPIPTFNDCWF